jgi:hypothetical protein
LDKIGQRRDDIYNYFHSSSIYKNYFAAHNEEFVAYYNSMYLLQDSTESLSQHRERGFATDALLRYLEFWGVTQAVIIQQDAIAQIYEVVFGKPLDTKNLQYWGKIRELRNVCVGHPAKKALPKHPLSRSFMGRHFGDYDLITYELWTQGSRDPAPHPRVPLGALLDACAAEAEAQLSAVLVEMKKRWPRDPAAIG